MERGWGRVSESRVREGEGGGWDNFTSSTSAECKLKASLVPRLYWAVEPGNEAIKKQQ